MNKSILIGIVVVILLLAGGAYFMTQRNSDSSMTNQPSSVVASPAGSQASVSPATDSAMSSGQVKEFTVTSEGLKFTPNQLTVKKGDMVKITYTNTVGTHDLVIDEFKVGTKRIGAGQSETIEFTADQAGTFEFYCSVPGHKQAGMVGTLTVTE